MYTYFTVLLVKCYILFILANVFPLITELKLDILYII